MSLELTREETAFVHKMQIGGGSWKDIAEHLGVGVKALRSWRKRSTGGLRKVTDEVLFNEVRHWLTLRPDVGIVILWGFLKGDSKILCTRQDVRRAVDATMDPALKEKRRCRTNT